MISTSKRRAELGHLAVGPFAVEDEVGQARDVGDATRPRGRRRSRSATTAQSGEAGDERPCRTRRPPRPRSRRSGAGGPGAGPGWRRTARSRRRWAAGARRGLRPPSGAAAVSEVATTRSADAASARSASSRMPRASGRELPVRVEAVVHDPPAEALPQRRGQRGPEGRLDEQHDAPRGRSARARRRQAGERGREGARPSQAPVGGDPPAARPRSAAASRPARRPSASAGSPMPASEP